MGFGCFWLIAMWASWLSHVFLWCSQEPPEDAPDAPRVSVGAEAIAILKSEAQRQTEMPSIIHSIYYIFN